MVYIIKFIEKVREYKYNKSIIKNHKEVIKKQMFKN